MKKYEYLYDFTPEELLKLEQLPYKKAIQLKILKAVQLKKKLLKEGYSKSDMTRVNKVHKAIKFNENLLKELKEDQ